VGGGHVAFNVTRLQGDNAVVSGVFFDPNEAVSRGARLNSERLWIPGVALD
jgi:hypothetical protein